MPKQKGKNAFFFFIVDWKKRMEMEGRKFPNGLKDVQADPDCNAEWQSLTKQQKGPYERMAKDDKISSQMKTPDKKTSLGESIKMLQEKEMEEQKFIDDMHEYLKSTITSAIYHNILPEKKFCLVHVNWFFTRIVDNVTEYFPAEYTIGIFSLENGLEDIHHQIVGAPIPLGYKREAMETSQNYHNIPIEYTNAETDFAVMYKKLISFLEPRKIVHKYPPLYTIKELKRPVLSLLKKLSVAAQEDEDQFLVYDLEALFKYMADEAYKKRSDRDVKFTNAYAEYIFSGFNYNFSIGYKCLYHKYAEQGAEYCSKSTLYNWVWKICDEVCEALEIKMKPGIHFPEKANSDLNSLTQSLDKFNMEDKISRDVSEVSTVVSMTGVSELHRRKVSERTYEEEMRRRHKSKPVVVIDHSKLDESCINVASDKSVKPVDSFVDETDENYVPNYSNEKPMRPPNVNTTSYAHATMDDYVPQNNEKNFPPIGGRGVLYKTTYAERKIGLGRGKRFTESNFN